MSQDTRLQGDQTVDTQPLTAYRPSRRMLAMGLAVDYLMAKPAFARLAFGPWSQALAAHINKESYVLVADSDRHTVGMAAWSIVTRDAAEAWVNSNRAPAESDYRDTGCVLMSVWAADSARVHRFMISAARKLFRTQEAIFFRRIYADGRIRNGVILSRQQLSNEPG